MRWMLASHPMIRLHYDPAQWPIASTYSSLLQLGCKKRLESLSENFEKFFDFYLPYWLCKVYTLMPSNQKSYLLWSRVLGWGLRQLHPPRGRVGSLVVIRPQPRTRLPTPCGSRISGPVLEVDCFAPPPSPERNTFASFILWLYVFETRHVVFFWLGAMLLWSNSVISQSVRLS